MRKMSPRLLSLIAVMLLMIGCNENELQTDQALPTLSKKVLQKLKDFNVNTNNVKIIKQALPDGTSRNGYLVEGDIFLTYEQIMAFKKINPKVLSKNYSTTNTVTPNTTIDIMGYTANNALGLSSNEQTALIMAVQNFNELNLNITFNLTFGTDFSDKDMFIYVDPYAPGSGGSAGYPAGGVPNKWIEIHGLSNSSLDIIEHVITHEIGHSIGLRHTDWQTRQSCGENINEGHAGIGAVAIPGTSAGYDPTSLMLACFSSNTTGEFNSNDIIALNYLF